MTELPIRVAVWGVGMLGSALVQAISTNPDLKLVAAHGYNESKKGSDAGEVAGAGMLEVPITLDPQDLIDSRPDIVLYVPRDLGDFATDADVLRLLEAGCNTITALPYTNLKFRGDDVCDRFEAAAQKGGATFFTTGIDPDYIWERQVLTSSGACADLYSVYVTEVFRGDTLGEQTMPLFGFGKPVDEVRADTAFQQFVYNYIAPSMAWACEKMGRSLDKVTVRSLSEPTDQRIDHPLITVEPGTVGLSVTRMEGWIGDEVFARHDVKYHLGVNRPPEAPVDECWIAELDGRPSVRVVVQSTASVREGTDRYADDPKQIPPGYWISGGPLIRAIANVVAAPPGIKEPIAPEMHWRAPTLKTRGTR